MQEQSYKRPESVLIVVYTWQGEVLLMRRTRPPWFWQSVTGSLKWDETPRQAALRELSEETGLMATSAVIDAEHTERFPIIKPWRKHYAPTARLNLEHWFYLPLPTRRTIRLNRSEHLQCRWLPIVQAAQRSSSWTNRNAILAISGMLTLQGR